MTLPALLGGPAVRPQGPPAWPFPDEDVQAALLTSYQEGLWGKYHGGRVELWEERLCAYHGVAYAAACGSGTFAVELALRALKVGPGDEVVLAAYDYPGNFLSVHAVGAMPVLIDVASASGNLDPAWLPAAFGPATKAVIASHLHGGVVPMRELMIVAQEHGIPVIEDAAQQPGALIQGRKAGTWGDVGVLSFGGSKLLTAGRGGALLTNRADVHQRARTFQQRGNTVCPLSELQAAVLLPQLGKLDARNAYRLAQVHTLTERLRDVAGLRPFVNACTTEPGFYKLGWHLDAAGFGLSRDRFVAALRAEGIAFDEGFRALHVGRSPARWRAAGPLAAAERMHREALILHHPVLLCGEAEIAEVVAAVWKVRDQAARLASG